MKEILIIDIETTGFQNKGGKIVEVGMVSLNTETGEVKTIYDKVVQEKSMNCIDAAGVWIFKNSDLTLDEVLDAPFLEDELPEIQDIINKHTAGATAFNRQFDFNFLESRGIIFVKKLPCPMVLSTNICKLQKKNGHKGYKWPKVEEAWKRFYPEIEYTELHRGADDAAHEANIVFALIKLNAFKL